MSWACVNAAALLHLKIKTGDDERPLVIAPMTTGESDRITTRCEMTFNVVTHCRAKMYDSASKPFICSLFVQG